MSNFKILYDIKLLDMGLIPTNRVQHVSHQIEQLDDSSARRAKRKFRKAWRRAVRQKIATINHLGIKKSIKENRIQDIKDAVGWNCTTPTRPQRKERDRLVRLWIWEDINQEKK